MGFIYKPLRHSEKMGSKGTKPTKQLGLCMGFRTRDIVRFLYILIVVLFIFNFFGNVVSIGARIPWHTRIFNLMSLNYPGNVQPRPLPDCGLVNGSIFEKTVVMYINDDSLYQNVSNISRIKKIFLNNEESLSKLNKKLLYGIDGHSNFESIHSIFRDILLTRAIESSYKADVVKDILPNLRRQMDEHYRKRKSTILVRGSTSTLLERYKSCAVVGNSGVLHDSFKGAEIDDHEMVIRINNAMPKNMNQTMVKGHVGSKTTLSFMNSHILQQCLKKFGYCNCHPYGEEVPIMVYLCVPEHAISVASCTFQDQTPLFLTDGRFDAYVSRVAVWYSLKLFLDSGKGNLTQWERAHKHEFHYSSGFQAVIVSLALCEKVDLYGFGKRPNARHHFHSFQKKEHYAHDYEGEYLFYDELEADKIYENPFLCQAGIRIPAVRVFH